MGLCVYGFCHGVTIDLAEAQCDLGYSGQAHEVGTFYSHEEHVDPRSVSSSLLRGDSTATQSTLLHSVESRYPVPIGILAEVAGSIRNIVTF